eukprot:scaffold360_cov192-Amphora_coffeaeformis.AAC.5
MKTVGIPSDSLFRSLELVESNAGVAYTQSTGPKNVQNFDTRRKNQSFPRFGRMLSPRGYRTKVYLEDWRAIDWSSMLARYTRSCHVDCFILGIVDLVKNDMVLARMCVDVPTRKGKYGRVPYHP